MKQKQLMKILVGIALIIIGNVVLVIGFLIAIFASDANWLFMSLIGLAGALLGIALIIGELSRTVRIVKKYTPEPIKRRIKYIKHD